MVLAPMAKGLEMGQCCQATVLRPDKVNRDKVGALFLRGEPRAACLLSTGTLWPWGMLQVHYSQSLTLTSLPSILFPFDPESETPEQLTLCAGMRLGQTGRAPEPRKHARCLVLGGEGGLVIIGVTPPPDITAVSLDACAASRPLLLQGSGCWEGLFKVPSRGGLLQGWGTKGTG